MVDVDNVCVSQHVADYVACVRAQGASLGTDRGTRLGAEVGVQAAKVGGFAELRDSLEKKYSVSEASELEIVRACASVSGVGRTGATAATSKPVWKPSPLGTFTFAETVAAFEASGKIIARSDFSDGAPQLVVLTDDERGAGWQTGSIQSGRYVEQITGHGAWYRPVQPGPEGSFQAHFLVNVKPASADCAAWIIWNEQGGMGVDLSLFGDGRITLTLKGADGAVLREARSGTAAFRPGRDQLIDVRHANGRASVWVDGVEAVAEVEAPFPATRFALGLTGTGSAAFDDFVLSAPR